MTRFDDFTKTRIKVAAVDGDGKPDTQHVPGVPPNHTVRRMKDPALIGKRCIIHSSLIRWPEGKPMGHVILVEGSGQYYCEPEQIGVIDG